MQWPAKGLELEMLSKFYLFNLSKHSYEKS